MIKVLHEAKFHVLIHNDLQSAAKHLVNNVEAKLASGDRRGIAYDVLGALTVLAFSFEADLNFFGYTCVPKWEEEEMERKRFYVKVRTVFDQLGVPAKLDEKPFSVINYLKDFRDTVAHGKPLEVVINEVKEMTREEMDARKGIQESWTPCPPEQLPAIHDEKNAVWQILFKASGLTPFDTMTRGQTSYKRVE